MNPSHTEIFRNVSFSVVVKSPDLSQLRRTLKGELTKMWVTLADILEDEIDRFANRLYEKDIIAKGARDKKEYNVMMDVFISSMAVLDTIKKIENHCSTLLDILSDIGGAAKTSGANLRKSWRIAVKNEYGIEFLLCTCKYYTVS